MSYIELNITSDPNHLLMLDVFDLIRKQDSSTYVMGNKYTIFKGKHELGVAELVAVRDFAFRRINNTISYRITGKPAPYLAQILINIYAPKTQQILLDEVFSQLTFKYVARKQETTKHFLQEFNNHIYNQKSYA